MLMNLLLAAVPAASSGLSPEVGLAVVFLLVLANGFFVAAEFALVAVRRSRIDQLAEAGDSRAQTVQAALKHLDRYISGTQLGITLSSLALGWLGEPALAALMDRALAAIGIAAPSAAVHSAAAITTAFIIITFLHIVLGELAPKSIALTKPEAVSKLVARPLMLFSTLAYPAIWVLNGMANMLLRMLRIQPVSELEHVHSSDELRFLVNQSAEHGRLNETDTAMIAGVFDFHEKKARDVMRPRTEIVALPIDATEEDVWEVVRAERYSRYPVFTDTLDDVTGVFLAKDLWLHDSDKPFVLADHVRPTMYVPDNRPAERVLDDLRKTRAHLAVVLDEYGGTAGMLTLEDLIEEVIGDINDEYDFATRLAVETDGVLELAGSMSLVDVRSDYELDIPDGDWNTLGGFVFGELGRLGRMGDRVKFPGGELEVVAMDGRRVAAVRVILDRAKAGLGTAQAPAGA
ncbi:MAG TPA: hemolysin family protein [Gemmatimonadaceae bacterium]|nr:hemolysin family protein [Gemmatimonadaceae bacterium]